MELDTLAPAPTLTLTITHPETGVTFPVVVAGPYTTVGRLAAERLVQQAAKSDLTPEQDLAASEEFAATIVRELPTVTVQGAPVALDTPERARGVLAALPYLPGQVVKQYLSVFGFFSPPSAPSSPTSPTSETSGA